MAGGFTRFLEEFTIEIKRLQAPSLKETCINRLEGLILSGEWRIGSRLPSERDLAAQLGISRPVLHDSLVDLASKGLVDISPRRGVFINDYRTHGSVALLSSLLSYHNGTLAPEMIQSLMDMRVLMEVENAAQAALHRTNPQLNELVKIQRSEAQLMGDASEQRIELDFSFHLQIAVASGNLIYPLIINSFKNVYTSLTGMFFEKNKGTPVLEEVLDYHGKLVEAIAKKNGQKAGSIMHEMLTHGERHLKGD